MTVELDMGINDDVTRKLQRVRQMLHVLFRLLQYMFPYIIQIK